MGGAAAAQARVVRPVDLAHPAHAQDSAHLVGSQAMTGLKGLLGAFAVIRCGRQGRLVEASAVGSRNPEVPVGRDQRTRLAPERLVAPQAPRPQSLALGGRAVERGLETLAHEAPPLRRHRPRAGGRAGPGQAPARHRTPTPAGLRGASRPRPPKNAG
jgi:hypothetical protein